MTHPIPATTEIPPQLLPAPSAPFLQPLGVTVLMGIVSTVTLVTLVRGVLATGGGIPMLAAVLGGAAGVLVLLLRIVFRRVGTRSGWPTAIAVTLAGIAVYLALFVTGTDAPSLVSLRPEVAIAAVSVASGAASALTMGGWWRALGIVGGVGLVGLALTPVFAAGG
jgi:hypothetical protein